MWKGLILALGCIGCSATSTTGGERSFQAGAVEKTERHAIPHKAGYNEPIDANTLRTGAICRASETPFLQCRVGRKRFSLCGVIINHQRFAHYRGGTADSINFEHRGNKQSPISWARAGYSGGGEIQYRFSNAGFDYVLYDRTIKLGTSGRGRPSTRTESGIVVRSSGKVESHFRCDNSSEAGKGNTEPNDFMPEGVFQAERL